MTRSANNDDELEPQAAQRSEQLAQAHAEQLLHMSGDLDDFEDDFRVHRGARVQAPTSWRIARIALATAASLLLAVTLWIALRPRESLQQLARDVPAPAPARAPVLITETSIVHRFVALYRDDVDPDGRCPECWCVAQLAANGGDGRNVSDLHEDELLQATLRNSCVINPQRVVIVGLTGPATAMPKNDAEALEMSLCLLKKQSGVALSPTELAATVQCLPSSVDYCMTTWDK